MERCCGQATMVHADNVNSWWGVELPIPLLKHTKYYYFCELSMCRPMPTRGKVHKCLHSSATSSCRICTSPPVLHDRACSTVILAPQPSQAAGISSGEWLYHRRTLSLHTSADRPVPFNRFGKTESHAPAAQFRLSHLATAGLSQPRRSRKICSSWSRSLRAAAPALVAHIRCAPGSNRVSESTRDTVKW